MDLLEDVIKLANGEPVDVGLLVSRVIGVAIITASFAVKFPQILKIVRAGSVAGISPMSLYLDVAVYLVAATYNVLQGNALSTYGETLVILVQNIGLVFLMWRYNSTKLSESSSVLALGAGLTAAMVALPAEHRYILPLSQIPVGCAARIPQIWTNYSQQSTGQLSFVTFFMNFVGSALRCFTTLKQVNDPAILAGYVMGTTLNGIIVLQMLLYWSSSSSSGAGGKAPAEKPSSRKASAKKTQ